VNTPACSRRCSTRRVEIVGVHRTYLDRVKPIKRPYEEVVLASGKKAENLAKKMFGSKGLIRLGPVMPIMAVAEGIENALSWYGLGYGPDDVGIAAAGDLGQLAGGSAGTVPHPTLRKRVIPNAVPDPARPGMAMPAEVKELILLGRWRFRPGEHACSSFDGCASPSRGWANCQHPHGARRR
jgi:hypothetical protein